MMTQSFEFNVCIDPYHLTLIPNTLTIFLAPVDRAKLDAKFAPVWRRMASSLLCLAPLPI